MRVMRNPERAAFQASVVGSSRDHQVTVVATDEGARMHGRTRLTPSGYVNVVCYVSGVFSVVFLVESHCSRVASLRTMTKHHCSMEHRPVDQT